MNVFLSSKCVIIWFYILSCGIVVNGKSRRKNRHFGTLRQGIPRRSINQIDPYESWTRLKNHAEKFDKKKSKKIKQKKLDNALKGIVGPPGPRGPQGSPGPAGTLLTYEEVKKDFEDLLQIKLAHHFNQISPFSTYDNCSDKSCCIICPDIGSIESFHQSKLQYGFNHRLTANLLVTRKTVLQIKGFHLPFGGGSFQRGKVFDTDEGTFVAPKTGVYQFMVNIHIVHNIATNDIGRHLKPRENVKISICLQAICQTHTSLYFITGLISNNGTNTVNFSGILFVERSQVITLHIDNGSNDHITIEEGSDFSGYFIGS